MGTIIDEEVRKKINDNVKEMFWLVYGNEE
jgi:hypothetical protein